MCLSCEIENISNTDIIVYKVVKKHLDNYFLLFRNRIGNNPGGRFHKTKLIPKMLKHKNLLYPELSGFSCFETENSAKIYLKKLCFSKRGLPFNAYFTIIKMFIPKGTTYYKGRILNYYIGSNMTAIRSEKLVFIGEI